VRLRVVVVQTKCPVPPQVLLLLRSQKIFGQEPGRLSLEERLRIDRPGYWSKMDIAGRDWTDRLERVRRMGLEQRCLGKLIKNGGRGRLLDVPLAWGGLLSRRRKARRSSRRWTGAHPVRLGHRGACDRSRGTFSGHGGVEPGGHY
jgi:hypothetical protein